MARGLMTQASHELASSDSLACMISYSLHLHFSNKFNDAPYILESSPLILATTIY
jgi:hypothetical protein